MKKQKRTKSEQISLLNRKKKEVEATLDKANKESQKLETRILRRESEGLSAKFLKKILSDKRKATRSIRNKLKSINQRLEILTESP